MKAVLTLFLTSLIITSGTEKTNDATQRILDAWIKTQNEGTDAVVRNFIDRYYSTELIKQMKNYEEHVKFYKQIIEEFGKIQNVVYKVEEATDNKLKVQLLKQATPLVPEPDPRQILVVEIDLQPENRQYLQRGLGMGAMICYIKR